MKTKNNNLSQRGALPPFVIFSTKVYTPLKLTKFHETYYNILERFAHREIRKLIISIPPQHGKSLGSSVLLPAYMLGLDPDLKICIASYNASLASRFNRRVQRVIDSENYKKIFPETVIKSHSSRSEAIRTSSQVEIIGRNGELMSVGREGSLTGHDVDIFILDDLYKDVLEANSPLIRENCWEWYTSVVKTRLHNDSSELIVFTRWHEEDLIGTILSKEPHLLLENWDQMNQLDDNRWIVVNFEAIKESSETEIDPRKHGEVLWPDRHSSELLIEKRNLDSFRFDCLYQGNPSTKHGLLYENGFSVYREHPAEVIRKGNYTDTADLGDDYLCSICYDTGSDGLIYITDIVYTREGMEKTEKLVADMLNRNLTRYSFIESNNGGRGFARAVAKHTPLANIEWFHQSGNKEARILSNSSTVARYVRFPHDWGQKWPGFHNHLVTYRKLFKANRWHDAADTLTGIVEKEIVDCISKKIKKFSYSV